MKTLHKFTCNLVLLYAVFAANSITHAASTGTQASGTGTQASNPDIQTTNKTGSKAASDTVIANPDTQTIWQYYDISGTTSKELKVEMKQKGPKGYWAYARWYISWTGDCKISLNINYTMPRWVNKKNAPKKLQNKWESMIANLAKHEKGRGNHGINAANAIAKSNCADAAEITQKWAAQDKIFDKETGHGRKQGVVLP